MQNLTENEKMLIRYGLALALEKITKKSQSVRNRVNNITLLSGYKNQLQDIIKLIEKIEA